MSKKVYVSRQKPVFHGANELCLNDERMSKMWSADISFRTIICDFMNSVYFSHMHTYNPLVLNYFTDEEAMEMFYIYNAKHDVETRLFRIPFVMEKLNVMGPGEVVADTDVDNLFNIDYFDLS